jgi:4-amino-4-deoxy-L-arabinose transferase-like glycosyltransferase
MPQFFKAQIVLVLVAGVIFLTNLGRPKLWDEDEPRNAACAREMLERGDWVVPTFNYELRPQKPVFLYWLMMASYSTFGVNEFAARLPSALLAIGTTLVTFHLGLRLFGARVGFLGGLMMASCLMFGVAGRAATPDSCLIFFTSLSLLGFVWKGSGFGVQGSGALRLSWSGCLAIYAPMGLAVMAKGPVGLVLPLAAIGLFLLLVDRGTGDPAGSWPAALKTIAIRFIRTAWSMRPLTALMVVAVIAGPWYVLVGLRTEGEWLRAFLGTENLSRFRGAMEGHGGPIVYYVGAVLIGFFPWSIVLPAAVWFAVRDALRVTDRNPSYLLLVCWAGVWIGVFSLAGTKLPSYVLPAYPAVALMSAAFVDRWLKHPACAPRWLMTVAWGSLALVGAGMLVALPLAARRFMPGEELIGLVGLIPLVGGLAAIFLQSRSAANRVIAVVSATAILLSVSLFAGATVSASRHHNSAALVELSRENGRVQLATFAHPESSVVYYAFDRVQQLTDLADVERFFERAPDACLITNSERWEELQSHLPPDIAVVARQPRFLKGGEVLLVRRSTEGSQTAAVPASLRL